MKKLLIYLLVCGAFSSLYCDQAQMEQMVQMKLQQLTEVDEQIENLVKQRVQLKMQAAQDVARGADSILPREARREDRSAEEVMQQIQGLNQQIEQLQAQREEILSALQ
ncbi:MAG: hypothetical protein JSS09_04080 [Verrucomicrobia bacterium]|nr:hypothetical protein [Verrucomicrobiota bacterium]